MAIVRWEGTSQRKIPMNQSGIETATYWHLMQCLNKLCHSEEKAFILPKIELRILVRPVCNPVTVETKMSQLKADGEKIDWAKQDRECHLTLWIQNDLVIR
jgi:hypothetical protein